MVFNTNFNNISVLSWWSVLLVEETGVARKETTDLPPVTNKLYYRMLYRVHLAWMGFKLTILVVIGTDCICNYKFNYYMISSTTVPYKKIDDLQTTNKTIYTVQNFLSCHKLEKLVSDPYLLYLENKKISLN